VIIRNIAACVLATTVIGASAGESELSRLDSDSATGSGCSSSGGCANFQAQRFINEGIWQGSVRVSTNDPKTPPFFQVINCTGPAFADALFLTGPTGVTRVQTTLDPTAPGCTSTNVSAPITLNVNGGPDAFSTHVISDVYSLREGGGDVLRERTRTDTHIVTYQNGTVGHLTDVFLGGIVVATRRYRIERDAFPSAPH
jgi:hypothetical protein